MLTYEKVVFVCESNTCRSPIATAIFNRSRWDRRIEAESKGTVVLFVEPANQKAVAIAKSRGIDIENHKTKLLDSQDFGEKVLVLVMTEKIKVSIYNDFEEAINVYKIKEFIDEQGDVRDPYGGDLQAYGEFFDEMEQTVEKVINKIYKEEH